MADLFSRKAKFELVKEDMRAVAFHCSRFENGSRDPLALQCYQMIKQEDAAREKTNG
jgi:hypothetical protein